MSAVDVLAVMDAHTNACRHALTQLEEEIVSGEVIGYEKELADLTLWTREAVEARAAVAELTREADIVADALTQDGRGPAGMTKEVAAKRLRAALARVQGASA